MGQEGYRVLECPLQYVQLMPIKLIQSSILFLVLQEPTNVEVIERLLEDGERKVAGHCVKRKMA